MKALVRLMLFLFSISLIGCASVEPVAFKGPNGKSAYSMRCSGFGRTMQECFQKAGDLCPSGYSIIDNSSGTVAFANNGTLMAAPRRELAVECK